MAEVLSPLSQPSSTVTMLQTRSASSDVFQSSPAASPYPQSQRLNNTPRTIYTAPTGYRGSTSPVQPYAFQATPQLRSSSSSSVPQVDLPPKGLRHGHNHTASASTVSSDMSSAASATVQPSPTKDELFSGSAKNSFINLSTSIPDLTLTPLDNAPKPSPNRYRRSPQRLDSSSSVNRSSVYSAGLGPEPTHTLPPPPTNLTHHRTASDDIIIAKPPSSAEAAKRYRRRSLNNLDATKISAEDDVAQPSEQRPAVPQSTIRPVSFHSRSSSTENTDPLDNSQSEQEKPSTRSPAVSPAKVPIRGSSANLSPLSRSALNDATTPTDDFSRPPPSTRPATASPAAQHLAALNDRDLNKGMKSRLRRAFSFGSAAELRRASENIPPPQSRGQTGPDEDLDPEQMEIIRQQEAAGIGAGIYSGQGGFTGSTDNLSISSTASSASIMLRKMGKGMKKGGRSLKGLFRPKSVIGVPAADGPVSSSSLAQVSMVTVEAERQKVNVNAHPADHAHGGTGFPKLEKNSMDAVRASVSDARTSNDRNDMARKSIVVADKDRAEVLAAVKRGILKRNDTSSPGAETAGNLSPVSVPATPRDDRASHSMSSATSDYFAGRIGSAVAKSMPSTPSGSRNISFSPRIQFYDAWSSGDYDRRGEVATCNRLTPMLAQQIKEELNTFKMEMEVHELSKPHTHFF